MKSELEELLHEVKSSQEKLIIETLISNFDNIPNMKLEEIARASYCSKTSVRRIIIKLGYKGYLEYQLHIKMANVVTNLDYNNTIILTGKSASECEQFINFFKNHKHITIYGHGSNTLAAEYLFRQLIELGYTATWINEQDLLHSIKDDAVVILSSTGRNQAIVQLASELKLKRGCTIAAITKSESELANVADITLAHNLENCTSLNDPMDSFVLINQISKML